MLYIHYNDLNFVARAYAHRGNSSSHKPCYDKYEMTIEGLKFSHNYELFAEDAPEFYTNTWLRFQYTGHNDQPGTNTWPKKRKNLYGGAEGSDLDEEEYEWHQWNEYWPPYTLYWHSYYRCNFPDWKWHDSGDWGEFRLKENDFGWTADEKVGKWWKVPTDDALNSGIVLKNCKSCNYIRNDSGWINDGNASIEFRIRRPR